MATSFRIESTIRGHHIFKEVWTPTTGEELAVNVELHNAYGQHAVAVCNVGGHVPREISRTCWYFLQKADSQILCQVTGHREHSQPGCSLSLHIHWQTEAIGEVDSYLQGNQLHNKRLF